MTGLDRFSDKEKRKARISNHIARDLRTPKYKQRVTPRVIKDEYEHFTSKDWEKYLINEEEI